MTSPQGTIVTLINNTDGSGNNFCQTLLDDDVGAANIQTAVTANAPFTGTWAPANPLSAFDGQNPNGTWTLTVQDFFFSDTGNIRAWSLIIASGAAVTIDQAAGQTDPTGVAPINFTATFDTNVTGFTGSDVTLGGTAPGTLSAVVSGGPSIYNVAVSGMTGFGTVTASIGVNVVDEGNAASTSTDNTVTFKTDFTGPACSYVVVNANPRRVDFTVSDAGSGLSTIQITTAVNIVLPVSIPPFTVGTNSVVAFSAVKDNQAMSAKVAVVITDVQGNQASCI